MKKTITLTLLLIASIATISFSSEKKNPTKNFPTAGSCEVCNKGSFRLVYQNVIKIVDDQPIPFYGEQYLQCNHCLSLKENKLEIQKN